MDPDITRIHGTYTLSSGYTFAVVPRDTCLVDMKDTVSDSPHEEGPTAQPLANRPASPDVANEDMSENAPSRASRPSDHTLASVPTQPATQSANQTTVSNVAKSDISSSCSVVKAIASLVQLLSAVNTLLAHRSDAIDRWG